MDFLVLNDGEVLSNHIDIVIFFVLIEVKRETDNFSSGYVICNLMV